MRKSTRIVICVLAGLFTAAPSPAPQAGAPVVPEEEAWVLFFLVMRTLPPPHWDFATKVNYLKGSGLSDGQVLRIVEAADEYFRRTESLDQKIEAIYEANPEGRNTPEVESEVARIREQKRSILRGVVSDLKIRLSPWDAVKLDEHIQTVRRQARVWTPGLNVRVLSEKPSRHVHQ
jgi:hypothetical protein